MKKFIVSGLFVALFASYVWYAHYFNIPAYVIEPKPAIRTVANSAKAYTDGSYVGTTEDAYYGNLQVRASISGGKLTDVVFLQYPNERSTSRYINQQALPALRSEAIQGQTAEVDGVSGASGTSTAFVKSLTSALAQAGA